MLLENIDSAYYKDSEGRVGRKAVSSSYLHRLQRRHFLLFNVLPLVGTIAAITLLQVYPLGTAELVVAAIVWAITGLGVTVGFHRYFTHRSFKASLTLRYALAIAGSMAGLGSVISWVAMHRRHHECADREGDMHSPNLHGEGTKERLRGFLHAHILWMYRHEYPNVNYYTPDLLRDKTIVKISRAYHWWILFGLLFPALICFLITGSWIGALNGFLWGGVVRMFVVTNAMWSLNSFLHTVGSRHFKVNDHSTNNVLLALISWGEGWHHNHHAFPKSAWFGLAWYRFDPGYWLIRFFQAIGLAWDVEVPTREQLESKRI